MISIKNDEDREIIAPVFDRDSGKFLGVASNIPKYEFVPKEKMKHWSNSFEDLKNAPFVQHEHVELYHKPGNSVCTIHIGCMTITYPC